MNDDCDEFEDMIDRRAAGTALGGEEERLQAHLEVCASCRAGVELLGELGAARFPEPAESDFARMRQGVLREIDAEGPARTSARTGFPGFWPWRWAGAALAASALFVAGVLAGDTRARSGGDTFAPPSATAELEALAGQLRRVAMTSGRVAETGSSPFLYSNVPLEPAGSGQIRLRFDAARHLDLRLAKDDPLVTEVVVQSLLGSSSVGTRLQAIEQAEGILEPRVKQALVTAMRHDNNLGVQMQAQAKLISQPQDAAIVDAMLDVLANEDSVQMRLTAIDYLTARQVPRGQLEHALGAGSAPANSAVAARADQYLMVTR